MDPLPLLSKIRGILGRTVRNSFERATGWDVYTITPQGVSLEDNIRKRLPTFDMQTVFDVGANVGQSANRFVEAYPKATVYSFEPVSETFETLEENLLQPERVRCFQQAFGAEAGTAEMVLSGRVSQYRFAEHREGAGESSLGERQIRKETVPVETIDGFCSEHAIDRVNLLKIDTEGHDLSVLEGATQMLSDAQIDLVQAEVAMSPLNELHVPFERIKDYMGTHQYYLFAVYEQHGEWVSETTVPRSVLRRADAVFVSPRLHDTQWEKSLP